MIRDEKPEGRTEGRAKGPGVAFGASQVTTNQARQKATRPATNCRPRWAT